MDQLAVYAEKLSLKKGANYVFSEREPWQIVTITTSTVLTFVWLWNFLNQSDSVYDRLKNFFFDLTKKIPAVSEQIAAEQQKLTEILRKEVQERVEGSEYTTELPLDPLKQHEILDKMDEHMELGKYNWREGHVSGAVYYFDENLLDMLTQVYRMSSYTNPLHPDIFPGIVKMEAEIIRMVANLFHGSSESCGSVTSGGTESILMACKAFRDYGKERGIKNGEILAPRTAHAAFDKACAYLGVKLKHIDLECDMNVDLRAMERAIGKNTILAIRPSDMKSKKRCEIWRLQKMIRF